MDETDHFALKDNIDAVGFANTAGSMALKQNFPNKNAIFLLKSIMSFCKNCVARDEILGKNILSLKFINMD